jgi:folate-binding Fe-S cluster repair protein YgfZ
MTADLHDRASDLTFMQKATPDTSTSNPSVDTAIDRSLGVVRVSGKDRLELLQGQFTQDLDRLAPTLPLLAGWASPKGRLICTLWLLDWQDSVLMILPAALCAPVAQRLTMFVLRSDVQVEVADYSVQPAARAQAITTIKPEDNSLTNCFYNDSYFFFEPVTGAGLVLGAAAPEGNIDHWRLACIRGGIPTVWP